MDNNYINLINLIQNNNQEDVIAYVLQSEAEKNNIKIFLGADSSLEYINYALEVYANRQVSVQRQIERIGKEKAIKIYVNRMGNLQVLKALEENYL